VPSRSFRGERDDVDGVPRQVCPQLPALAEPGAPRYDAVMNAVVLDGSIDEANRSILATLTQAIAESGHTAEVIALRDRTIAPCLGCFGCWVKTPGECVIDDDGRTVARAAVRSDILVYVTPVTFGGFSSELKKAVDRLIPNISPFFAKVQGETHHERRYARSPSLIGLGVLPQPDREAEAIFKTLVEHNALNWRSPRTAAGVVALDSPDAVENIVRGLVEAVAQ
jgi:multimeric flavodoxin WrbA